MSNPPFAVYTWPLTPFAPQIKTISAITQASPGVVTTSANHEYHTGQVIRLIVPPDYGMAQLNKTIAVIEVLSPTTFALFYSLVEHEEVDTRLCDPFIAASGLQAQVAAVTAIGESPSLNANGYFESTINDQVFNTLEV